MITLRKMLLATDFGEAAETALAYARELARMCGATLHIFHAVEEISAKLASIDSTVPNFSDLQVRIERDAHHQLENLLTEEDRRMLHAITILRVSNTPEAAIVSYANEVDIDLIVMGTHGRGPLAHFLMGSVAERVVRTARCPVLTVRHPQHEFAPTERLRGASRKNGGTE